MKSRFSPKSWSLRIRLLAVTLIFAAFAIVLSDIIATTAVGSYLVNQIDQQNSAIAQSSVARLDRFGLDPNAEGDENQGENGGAKPLGRVPTTTIINVIDAQGTLIAQLGGEANSDRLKVNDVAPLNLNAVEARNGKPFTIQQGDGPAFRVIAIPFSSGYGSLVVSSPLSPVTNTIHRLTALLSLISLFILLIIALISHFVIKLSFRPLHEIEITAENIAKGDLSARLEDDNSETEVGNLKRSLNMMLSRIEASFQVRVESEERLRRFVADASHELRTPLTAIRGFAELIRHGAISGEDKTKETISRIENESVRMTNLVEDMLSLARLDQSPIVEKNPIDLNKLLTEAVESAKVAGANHSWQIFLPSEEIYWLGDERKLHQCVANLLTNARTHTPEQTIIKVSLELGSDEYRILVSDNGPGISSEDQEKIFERFYRVDSSRSRSSGEGSGLGLAIVSSLMKVNGGKVSVKSQLGEGATFILHLPIIDN